MVSLDELLVLKRMLAAQRNDTTRAPVLPVEASRGGLASVWHQPGICTKVEEGCWAMSMALYSKR